MQRKYNLLEVCLSPDLGGLELYMVRCAKALSDDFTVFSAINSEGKLEQYYDEKDEKVFTLKKRSNLFMFKSAKVLADIIDKNEIDVLHLHWTKDIPISVLAKMFSKRRPKLVQTRNMTMTRFKNDFYHRFLYKHIDMMLPVTQQVADQIRKFIPKDIRPRVEVLYMGSDRPDLLNEEDLAEFRKSQGMQDTFSVGMVGRIEEAKGQYLLIAALKNMVKQNMKVQAFFVGHPMEESYLEKLKDDARREGVDHNIHFLGFMKNPHHFMQACDAIVLATPCETFGLVLTEAMQVGTAIVATNTCGPLEIIDDGETGVFFEKNNASDLENKLSMLCEDPDLLNQLARAGQRKAQTVFDSKKQFEKLSVLLSSLVREK